MRTVPTVLITCQGVGHPLTWLSPFSELFEPQPCSCHLCVHLALALVPAAFLLQLH